VLLLANLVVAPAASAGICIQNAKAYAFLIGNNDYHFLPKLANPKNDITDVQGALQNRGFIVKTKVDLNAEEIPDLLQNLGQMLCEPAEVGLLYYAGSAVEIAGRVYLVPVDFKLPDRSQDMSSELAIRSGLLPLDEVAKAFSRKAANSVYVIVDGCRDDPFTPKTSNYSRSSTIESVFSSLPPVKIVAFSDERGGFPLDGLTPESKNSPFAEAFVKALQSDQGDIDSILARVRLDVIRATNGRQRPDWYRGSGAGAKGVELLGAHRAPTFSADDRERIDTQGGLKVPTDPIAREAFVALANSCARCHQIGQLVSREKPPKDFGFILDFERLAADTRYISPGDPHGSNLFKRIIDKDEPYDVMYEGSLNYSPTPDDIRAVEAWIKSLPSTVLKSN
jgi:hypothetical protein